MYHGRRFDRPLRCAGRSVVRRAGFEDRQGGRRLRAQAACRYRERPGFEPVHTVGRQLPIGTQPSHFPVNRFSPRTPFARAPSKPSRVSREQYGLPLSIIRRPLDVIDHKHLDRAFTIFQLQSYVRQCSGKCWSEDLVVGFRRPALRHEQQVQVVGSG